MFRRAELSYQMMQYILEAQYGVAPEKIFKGLNNPVLKQLGYETPAEAQAIMRRFKKMAKEGIL